MIAPGSTVGIVSTINGGIAARPVPMGCVKSSTWYLWGTSRAFVVAITDDEWVLVLSERGDLGWFQANVLQECTW